MEFSLCVSSLVTCVVEDEDEGVMCHCGVVAAGVTDMCSMHSCSTRLTMAMSEGSQFSKDSCRRRNLAKKASLITASHPHNQQSLPIIEGRDSLSI